MRSHSRAISLFIVCAALGVVFGPEASPARGDAPATPVDSSTPATPIDQRTTVRTGLARTLPPLPDRSNAGQATLGRGETGSSDWFSSVSTMLGPLAVVVGIVLIGGAVLRRVARLNNGLASALGPGGRAPAGVVDVLGRYPAARGQSLVLLKLDRRVLLLSHSLPGRSGAGGFTTLADISAPEEVSSILMKVNESDGQSLTGRFAEVVGRYEREGDAILGSQPPAESVARPGTPASRGRASRISTDGDRAELLNADATPDQIVQIPGPSIGSLRQRLASLRGRVSEGVGR